MYRPISCEPTRLAGIPMLHVRARELQGPAPTILCYHGWGGKKTGQTILAEALACEGFRVLVPDLPRHGDRNPLPAYFAPEAWHQFWEVIIQAIEEADLIKNAAIDSGLADSERLGCVGNSAGGMVAIGSMARFRWVKASVLTNSCPCFEQLELVSRENRGEPPATVTELAQLRTYDPAALTDQIAPRPVLMLHGTADTTLPIDGVRRFMDLAQPLYAQAPGLLQLEEYPRLDHWVPTSMVTAARDWFMRHLQP